jgi:hypothetical protein
MFKNTKDFVDYLYTDFLCGTDTLDPVLCKQIISQLGINSNLVAHDLKKYCLSEIEDFNEIEFNKYCKFMLGVNYDLNNGV